MAYVANGFSAWITLVDNGNKVTTRQYELTSADAANAVTDTAVIVAALAAVTDAVIVSFGTTALYINNSISLPASGVKVSDIALMTCALSDPTESGTFTIPAPKPGIFVAASGSNANVVDLADAAVTAYAALFQTAGECYISDGETAGILKSGRRATRQTSKG